MNPSILGPYVLLALGAVAVAAAIASHFKELPTRSSALLWVFGVALLGIGSYGPAFLSDYVKFIKVLNEVSTGQSDPEAWTSFFASAENAGVSKDAQEAIVTDVIARRALAADRSSETAEAAFQEAMATVPANAQNREVLNEAKERVQVQINLRDVARRRIETAARGDAPAAAAEELEPLLELGEARFRELQLNRRQLQRVVESSREAGDG